MDAKISAKKMDPPREEEVIEETLDAASQFKKNLDEFRYQHGFKAPGPIQRFFSRRRPLYRRKILIRGSIILAFLFLGARLVNRGTKR